MPTFEFTEEQQQLIDTAREFARKEIVPVAGQMDEEGTFPRDICRKGWETGLMNCEIPEAYGGLEMDKVTAAVIADRIAKYAGFATTCTTSHATR